MTHLNYNKAMAYVYKCLLFGDPLKPQLREPVPKQSHNAKSQDTTESPEILSPEDCFITHESKCAVLIGYINSLTTRRSRRWRVKIIERKVDIYSSFVSEDRIRR
jgi:hypothetical protein